MIPQLPHPESEKHHPMYNDFVKWIESKRAPTEGDFRGLWAAFKAGAEAGREYYASAEDKLRNRESWDSGQGG